MDRWTDSLMPSWLPRNPGTLNGLNVPGLHNLITRVPPVSPKSAPYAAVFTVNWLTASGTACFLPTIASAFVLRVRPKQFVATYVATFRQLSFAMLTIALMRGRAYLMNY
jgi:lactate permease